MKKTLFSPEGSRLLVDDVISELSLEQRAAKSNLHVVVHQENRPRTTEGIIVAIGPDPYLWEPLEFNGVKRPRYMIGDHVFFDWHAGKMQILEDHEFRSLEAAEITGCNRIIELPDPSSQEQDSLSVATAPAGQSEQCPSPEQPTDLCDTSRQES